MVNQPFPYEMDLGSIPHFQTHPCEFVYQRVIHLKSLFHCDEPEKVYRLIQTASTKRLQSTVHVSPPQKIRRYER